MLTTARRCHRLIDIVLKLLTGGRYDRFGVTCSRLAAHHARSRAGTGCTAVADSDARVLANGVSIERSMLCRDAVHMDGTVTALRGNILIKRIPGNPLNVMAMFCKLT